MTKIAKLISDLQANIDNLRNRIANPAVDDDAVVCARKSATNLIPAMSQLRDVIDELETLVPDDLWPVPKYRELLTVH